MPNNENPLHFPCLIVKQGKYQLACFVTQAQKLWSFVKINTRDSDKDTGYQRVLSPARVKSVSKYIKDGNAIPNSILIALDAGAEIVEKDNTAILVIPNREDAGWVIDGQHRLVGTKESETNIDIVVVAFVGLSIDEQVKQFVTVNREAKNVPTALYLDLLKYLPKKTDAEMARERATGIVDELKKKEESPFFQRLVVLPPSKGQISITNFVRKVAPLVLDKKGKFYVYTLQEQIGIIDNYYRALENIFPDAFRNNRLTFFKTLGFGAMMNVLQTVFDLCLKEHKEFTVEAVSRILKRVDYFDFAAWDKLGTGTAAENFAGEDFRTELLKSFDDSNDSGTLRL